jgi:Protein of unknown function (DUF2510)
MRFAGRLMVMTGALAFVAITTLAPYVEVGAYSRTVWDLMTRAPVVFTVIAAAAFVLTVANLSAELVVPSAIASGLSFWLLGSFFFLTARNYDAFGWGYWTATGAAAVMAVGGVLSLVGYRLRPNDGPDIGPSTAAPTSVAAPIAPNPSPGWYPDPLAANRQRYWSGTDWTDDLRD